MVDNIFNHAVVVVVEYTIPRVSPGEIYIKPLQGFTKSLKKYILLFDPFGIFLNNE
jgi:hypothetical protein